jgi:hypothetical protein
LEVAKAKGYSTIQVRVMSAEYWTTCTMKEAGNDGGGKSTHTTKSDYKVSFPSLWTSSGVVPQRELVEYGLQYVRFETLTKTQMDSGSEVS